MICLIYLYTTVGFSKPSIISSQHQPALLQLSSTITNHHCNHHQPSLQPSSTIIRCHPPGISGRWIALTSPCPKSFWAALPVPPWSSTSVASAWPLWVRTGSWGSHLGLHGLQEHFGETGGLPGVLCCFVDVCCGVHVLCDMKLSRRTGPIKVHKMINVGKWYLSTVSTQMISRRTFWLIMVGIFLASLIWWMMVAVMMRIMMVYERLHPFNPI